MGTHLGAFSGTAGPDAGERLHAMFGEHDPSKVAASLGAGIHPDYSTQTVFHAPHGSTGLSWETHFIDPSGSRIATARRSAEPGAHVSHNFFALPEEHQAHGLGTQYLANSINAYQKGGAKQVNVFAALDAGGYTWGRLGFKPHQMSWDNLRSQHIPSRILEQHKAGKLDQGAALQLLQHTQNADPSALWKVADHPAGKSLLAGASWHGSLDLDPGSEGIKRLNAAVARSRQKNGTPMRSSPTPAAEQSGVLHKDLQKELRNQDVLEDDEAVRGVIHRLLNHRITLPRDSDISLALQPAIDHYHQMTQSRSQDERDSHHGKARGYLENAYNIARSAAQKPSHPDLNEASLRDHHANARSMIDDLRSAWRNGTPFPGSDEVLTEYTHARNNYGNARDALQIGNTAKAKRLLLRGHAARDNARRLIGEAVRRQQSAASQGEAGHTAQRHSNIPLSHEDFANKATALAEGMPKDHPARSLYAKAARAAATAAGMESEGNSGRAGNERDYAERVFERARQEHEWNPVPSQPDRSSADVPKATAEELQRHPTAGPAYETARQLLEESESHDPDGPVSQHLAEGARNALQAARARYSGHHEQARRHLDNSTRSVLAAREAKREAEDKRRRKEDKEDERQELFGS